MVHVLELRRYLRREVQPGAAPQRRPWLNAHCSPPRQRSSCQERHGDLHLLPVIDDPADRAILRYIEQPILQFTCVALVLLWLVQFQLRSRSSLHWHGLRWRCRRRRSCYSRKSCMPPLANFCHHILDRLRCSNSCMGQTIIQLLIT